MADFKNDSFSELLSLIEKHELTAYEIAKNTGLSSVGVQKIIDGKTKKPSKTTVSLILDFIKKEYLLDKSYTQESVITSDDVQKYIFDKASIEDKLKLIFEQNCKILHEYSELKEILNTQAVENRDHKNIIVDYIDLALQPVMDFIGAKKKERENS